MKVTMDVNEEKNKLLELHCSGEISDEEFDKEYTSLLINCNVNTEVIIIYIYFLFLTN